MQCVRLGYFLQMGREMGGIFWLLHPSQSCTEHMGRGAEITRSVGLALRVQEAPQEHGYSHVSL